MLFCAARWPTNTIPLVCMTELLSDMASLLWNVPLRAKVPSSSRFANLCVSQSPMFARDLLQDIRDSRTRSY